MSLPEIPADLGVKGVEALLLYKLAGPSVTAMGETLRGLVETASTNVGNVFKNATQKLGPRIEVPGAMPTRALGRLIDESAFSDDEIVVDYLGGVLASSRTPDGKDDRGVVYTAQIARLSRDQLRLHYLLYSVARRELLGKPINVGIEEERNAKVLFLAFDDFIVGLGLDPRDTSWVDRWSEAWNGLHREGLVADAHRAGTVEHLQADFPGCRLPGLIWRMSISGVLLYMWGTGYGTLRRDSFFDPAVDLHMLTDVPEPTQSGLVSVLASRVNDPHREAGSGEAT